MNADLLEKDLEAEEGFIPHAYQDHLGYWTIGIGRLVDKKKGGGITKDEAFFLLRNDIKTKWSQLLKAIPWIKDHPEPVQRALLNMAFQMGVPGLLGFKNTLNLIKGGEYVQAADNALLSKWAKQTPARARRVTDLIRNAKGK